MIRNFSYLILLALLGMLIFSSCSMSRQLSHHRNALAQAASSSYLSPAEKLDVLGESLAKALDQGLDRIHPKKSGEFFSRYFSENSESMERIMEEVEGSFREKNPLQKAAFAAGLALKDWPRQVARQLGRLDNKYRQLHALAKLKKFL